jgi:sugar-phosphatase
VPIVLRAAAILFDMDGVLVDSRAAIDRVRRRWARRRGLDEAAVVALPHGRKTSDIIAALAPHLDLREEVAWLDADEERDLEGIVAIPGAAPLLRTLAPGEWAVVTSSGSDLARRRLRAAGLPVPGTLVSGDMVSRGKPAPEGYLLAARQLGVPAAECVVFEDAPAGIEAGVAAGARAVGVATTYAPASLAGCTAIVSTLADVSVERKAGVHGLLLHLTA